jgi:hypothetical protein
LPILVDDSASSRVVRDVSPDSVLSRQCRHRNADRATVCCGAHHAVLQPSTITLAPVMCEDASDTMNSTTPRCSSRSGLRHR